jgi:hypothetical protein
MTSTTCHPAQLVDGAFAALNSDDPALTVTALEVAVDDLAEQLNAAVAEISALPADTYSDDERAAYTRDAMAAHLQRVTELEASPVAFLGLAGYAEVTRRAKQRTDQARARAAQERWDAAQAAEAAARADAAREARRARDAHTARVRRAARFGYLPQASGLQLGVDFAAMAAADDQYAVDVRGDLALAGLL